MSFSISLFMYQPYYFIVAGYIQPSILEKRFEKGDQDGFLDCHWFITTSRKKVYFRDIGAKAASDDDLARLFQEVYDRHHDEDHSVNFI